MPEPTMVCACVPTTAVAPAVASFLAMAVWAGVGQALPSSPQCR